jgi:hypothetical protein
MNRFQRMFFSLCTACALCWPAAAQDLRCDGCDKEPAAQLRSDLRALHEAHNLRADVYFFLMENRPFDFPLRVVEQGALCTLTDEESISKLVSMMDGLKVAAWNTVTVRSTVEIRFTRADRPSDKPVFEAFFDVSAADDTVAPIVTPVLINGHRAMVYTKEAAPILDFAGDLTEPPGNKVCAAFRDSPE